MQIVKLLRLWFGNRFWKDNILLYFYVTIWHMREYEKLINSWYLKLRNFKYCDSLSSTYSFIFYLCLIFCFQIVNNFKIIKSFNFEILEKLNPLILYIKISKQNLRVFYNPIYIYFAVIFWPWMNVQGVSV